MSDTYQSVMQAAADHLQRDPVLAPVITRAGLCTIRPHREYYRELIESIIGQQLSVKAADAIGQRFWALFDNKVPTPQQILALDHDTLRSVGFSNAKARYMHNLAEHIASGQLELEKFDSLSDQQIIQELTAVKGIGEWSAHMFMMFAMARLDVLAVGDLGIRTGIRDLYGFSELPNAQQITQIAVQNNWHPYKTVACWYVWHAKDNKP